jgi:hypothetical protein
MASIRVNGMVNGLVHKGGSWISTATLPDVCKTPTPGGPVPMPYPNVSTQGSLKNGTKTIKVDGGNMAATKGSKYAMSTGDEPGTLGGIKSSSFKKASTWIMYAFDVKLDGKNACRFTDKKFQNNENTIDAAGVLPTIVKTSELDTTTANCGDVNQYGKQPKKDKHHRDHVPSYAALEKTAIEMGLPICKSRLQRAALSIMVPTPVHSNFSRTYAGKNKKFSKVDKKDLQKGVKEDLEHLRQGLKKNDPACLKKFEETAKKLEKITHSDYKKWLKKVLKDC